MDELRRVIALGMVEALKKQLGATDLYIRIGDSPTHILLSGHGNGDFRRLILVCDDDEVVLASAPSPTTYRVAFTKVLKRFPYEAPNLVELIAEDVSRRLLSSSEEQMSA